MNAGSGRHRKMLLAGFIWLLCAGGCDSQKSSSNADPGPGPNREKLPSFSGIETPAVLTAENGHGFGESFYFLLKEYQQMVEGLPPMLETPSSDSLLVTVDDSGDPVHGTLDFKEWAAAEDVRVESGTLHLEMGGFGTLDEGPSWMRMEFDEVAVHYAVGTDDAFELMYSGELYVVRSSNETFALTIHMDAASDGVVHRLENVVMTHARGTVVIEGRHFDSGQGYVDWTTVREIETDHCGPREGTIQGIGESGAHVEIRFSTEDSSRLVVLWWVDDAQSTEVGVLDTFVCLASDEVTGLPDVFRTKNGDFVQAFVQRATRRVGVDSPMSGLWRPDTYLRMEINVEGDRHELYHHQGREWRFNGEIRSFFEEGRHYIAFTSEVEGEWGLTLEVLSFSETHLHVFSPWGEDEGGWEFLFTVGIDNLGGLLVDSTSMYIAEEPFPSEYHMPLTGYEVALGTWDGENFVPISSPVVTDSLGYFVISDVTALDFGGDEPHIGVLVEGEYTVEPVFRTPFETDFSPLQNEFSYVMVTPGGE